MASRHSNGLLNIADWELPFRPGFGNNRVLILCQIRKGSLL